MHENRESVFLNLSISELKSIVSSAVQEALRQLKGVAGLEKSTEAQGEYLSAQQVMELLKIGSRSTLWQWEREGYIPHSVKVPGRRRCLWKRADLEAVLADPHQRPVKGQWRK